LPIAQGMGFVTAEYNNLTPYLYSQMGFSSLTEAQSPGNGIQKYIAKLGNGVTWAIYIVVPQGQSAVSLSIENYTTVVANGPVNNVIFQVGIVDNSNNNDLDPAAGMFPVGVTINGTVTNDVVTYVLNYNTQGTSSGGTTFLWALPHHVQSFSSEMANRATTYTIDSTTKGIMTGYLTNQFILTEQLYTDLQWMPYSSNSSFQQGLFSQQALNLMQQVAVSELAQNITGQVYVPSTYTAGKAYDKFAYILYVAHEILKNETLAYEALVEIQQAYSIFTTNSQPYALMYDTVFKGVTSSAGQNGDSTADYGSPYYNDHHFHYGYFVHSAAVIGLVDNFFNGTWVQNNKDWVNSLVRDVANPSTDDTYFPVFRMFDFYNGHSWASGLFASAAGRNEESTSEDYNFAYGMKLWGQITGDKQMEARGDLMLAIMKRSMIEYVLMEDDNTIQPSNYIANKVAGITFENQLDHTTYFGTNLEYIQGIQMIPTTPASGLIRPATFVEQEWNELLQPIFSGIDSGWAGILKSNQALYDPQTAFDYFNTASFDSTLLDNGASQTWYLALTNGLLNG
jgi:endo-1,3(4)-beta-glucanase